MSNSFLGVRSIGALAGSGLLLWFASTGAEQRIFDTAEAWQAWRLPTGLVHFDESGALRLRRFERRINPVIDAGEYLHQTRERGLLRGGIWQVGSNPVSAPRVIDGVAQTFWKPDPDDGLRNWLIEVDLGRVVLAQEVVLDFPDHPGARPFRQFGVFTSSGQRFRGRSDDVFIHREVFSTTLPNHETQIRIPLGYNRGDTLQVLDPDVDIEEARRFLPVQYVRLEAHSLSEDAALAEIEVVGIGGNIGPGTLARGGALRSGELVRSQENAIDGDMDTQVALRDGLIEESWRASGMWLQLDLGATFWIDRIFLSPLRSGFALTLAQRFFAQSENAGLEPFLREGEFNSGYRHYLYVFRPRKIRHLIVHALDGRSWGPGLDELMVYASGYPAQIELRSDFIDLGGERSQNRYKAIGCLSWDVELPPATRIQLRSRSGDSLRREYTFYDRKGAVVSERSWINSPKVLRGPIDSTLVAADDWDEWSNVYQLSGERFKSRTPTRLVQLEAIIATEDPAVTPVLHALSMDFTDALVQRAAGRILPRRAEPNQTVRFMYGLWPQGDSRDRGFDRLRLAVPGPIDESEVTIEVGGERVDPAEISIEADSLLLVTLPVVVKSDSVRIGFNTRVLRNATVFDLHLGHTQKPDIWQFVAPVERHADVVFLPELIGRDRLIDALEISPPIFTPNGDGINDRVEIRFVILKAQNVVPGVRIFDLAGQMVTVLEQGGDRGRAEYSWDGRDAEGNRVGPGVYLCDIDLGAESGDDRITRLVAVAY